MPAGNSYLKSITPVKNTVIRFTLGILSLLPVSCSDNQANVNDMKPYTGPLVEVNDMKTFYSDSAIVRVMVEAKKQLEYENGNSEFPEGIYIEFYKVDGRISSTLKANKGYYNKEKNLYTARENVVVNSFEKNQKLNTEELHWKPDEDKIFTDKFVRIETEDEILMGEGLTSNQDFTDYHILNPTGELEIKE